MHLVLSRQQAGVQAHAQRASGDKRVNGARGRGVEIACEYYSGLRAAAEGGAYAVQGEKDDVELVELDVALVFVVHEVGGNDEDGAQGCSSSIAAYFSAS